MEESKSIFDDGKEWITTREAARRLKRTQARIRQMLQEGYLKESRRFADRVWVSAEEVASFAPPKRGRPPRKSEEAGASVLPRSRLALA